MAIIQRNTPQNRILQVLDRANGTAGVLGTVYMLPGETLDWALEFKGTQLPPGTNLYAMSSPTIGGANSAYLTCSEYAVDDTQAKFLLALSGSATTASVITLRVTVQLTSVETMIVSVPFTVVG